MTLIRGGPAGPNPDEASGAYANEVASDRAALYRALGGVQGILYGFTYTLPASLSMQLAAGAALVEERDGSGNIGTTGRGYFVWDDTTVSVAFDAPDASSRVDAVVICFADVEAGALGSGVSQVGPQVIVVRGVSGTTTARTDAQINAAVGRGGWVRYADVKIDPGNTQVQAANVTAAAVATTDGKLGFGLRKVVVFTANGSFTKASFPWLRKVRARISGSGGAGAGAPATGAGQSSGGAGGGCGEYAERLFDVSELGATEAVTVAAGGTGVSGGTGNAGGASSLGALLTANGGNGGAVVGAASSSGFANGTLGGSGGSGTADVRIPGGAGGVGGRTNDAGAGLAGTGGSGPLGGGGVGAVNSNGGAGGGFGAGGGGSANSASQAARTGGAGAGGVVILELFG